MTDSVEIPFGLRTLAALPLEGRRVFVRTDLDDSPGLGPDRLRLALPTLEAARSRGAKLIVATVLARPNTRKDEQQIEPAAARLAEALGADVFLPDECAGDAARKIVQELRPGQICVLENLGSERDEANGDRGFAERLAALTDVYVNDAFSASAAGGASIVSLPELVGERGIGLWFERELLALHALRQPTKRPFFALVGGSATRERLVFLESLLQRADEIAVGGALGTTLLAASGVNVQASAVNSELFAEARSLLSRARDRKVPLRLPIDVVTAEAGQADHGLEKRVNSLPQGSEVVDLGPETLAACVRAAEKAKTVLWAGALGAVKDPAFAQGSLAFARVLAASTAVRVVLDGPVIAALRESGEDLVPNLGFVSTGGRASLEYIEGRALPGIEALRGGET